MNNNQQTNPYYLRIPISLAHCKSQSMGNIYSQSTNNAQSINQLQTFFDRNDTSHNTLNTAGQSVLQSWGLQQSTPITRKPVERGLDQMITTPKAQQLSAVRHHHRILTKPNDVLDFFCSSETLTESTRRHPIREETSIESLTQSDPRNHFRGGLKTEVSNSQEIIQLPTLKRKKVRFNTQVQMKQEDGSIQTGLLPSIYKVQPSNRRTLNINSLLHQD